MPDIKDPSFKIYFSDKTKLRFGHKVPDLLPFNVIAVNLLIWEYYQECLCRVNGNLNLSRAIGDLKYKTNKFLPAADQIISAEPDVTQTNLTQGDWFLVLACDGVWDVMNNQVHFLSFLDPLNKDDVSLSPDQARSCLELDKI